MSKNSRSYRFIYFDLRGAGELCRYVLACSGADWEDVRYPMKVAAQGFAYGPEFYRDSSVGGFDCNMGNLPVLQITNTEKTRAYATVGQSHSIARFVARTHGMMGEDALDELKVDAVYECCRDIKSSWYRVKKQPNGRKEWFDAKNISSGETKSLSQYCQRLEKVLASTSPKKERSSPWCLNTPNPTLADIAVYHLLGTPVSVVSGSTESFFDGENAGIVKAYENDCPRITKCLKAMSDLKEIKEWENKRPDTFT